MYQEWYKPLLISCEAAEVIPAVDQVELHPYFVQSGALENMKAYGVVPQAWGPLAEGKHGIFTDPELIAIGKKYGKTAAQVALRWNAQRGVSIIPKSVHGERMEQNLDIWDFTLTDEEMTAIAALKKDYKSGAALNFFFDSSQACISGSGCIYWNVCQRKGIPFLRNLLWKRKS